MNVEKKMALRIIESDELPKTVDGCVVQVKEEDYLILINKELAQKKKADTFIHEMMHIWEQDFEKSFNEVYKFHHN